MSSVELKNSKIVIYTKSIASGTILNPDYGIVCAQGSVDGIDFSIGCGVEFSSFGDSDTVEQVEYEYVIDSEGCFKLSLKESAGQ